MLYNILYLFLLFFVYSILGYFLEVIMVTIGDKKITFSRGFLIGPYIPIYGVGVLILTRCLTRYQNDLVALFVMSVVSCSILEYLTSYFMEKIFKLRWWDYSHLSFNLNGRICLLNSIIFGFFGVLIVSVINPFVEGILTSFSKPLVITLSLICLTIFVIDFILSLIAVLNIQVDVKKYTKKDATAMIKKEVSKKYIYLKERLAKAFPNAKAKLKSHPGFTFATYKETLDKKIQEIKQNKLLQKNNQTTNKKK